MQESWTACAQCVDKPNGLSILVDVVDAAVPIAVVLQNGFQPFHAESAKWRQLANTHVVGVVVDDDWVDSIAIRADKYDPMLSWQQVGNLLRNGAELTIMCAGGGGGSRHVRHQWKHLNTSTGSRFTPQQHYLENASST